MKINIDELVRRDLQQVMDIKDNSYRLTMPFLAAAMLNDGSTYQRARDAFTNEMPLSGLKAYNYNSVQLWLVGRVALAASLMGDNSTLKNSSSLLEDTLSKSSNSDDPFLVWAWAYLISSNSRDKQSGGSSNIETWLQC